MIWNDWRTRRRAPAAVGAALVLAAGAAAVTAQVNSTPSHPAPAVVPGGEPTSPLSVSCGVERWHVKTGVDSGASSVVTAPQSTTIAALTVFPYPGGNPKALLPDTRNAPLETTVHSISATVTAYKVEGDSDVHLALVDGSGNTMIAEIPDPGCVGKSSPFAKQIAVARATWEQKYKPSPNYVSVNQKVTLTGVGFFDKIHGQRGVAPNGAELHPVLTIALH